MRKRKKKNKKTQRRFIIIALIVVIIVQATVVVDNMFTQSLPPSAIRDYGPAMFDYPDPNIPISGYDVVEVEVTPSIIYLTSGCRQLAMITTEGQTYSIQNGLDNVVDFRPTTHDVMADLIENLRVEVIMARVDSLEDSIFFAKLFVQQGNKVLGLDSKSSDSIAIAVRFDAPVYVNRNIMISSGIDIC